MMTQATRRLTPEEIPGGFVAVARHEAEKPVLVNGAPDTDYQHYAEALANFIEADQGAQADLVTGIRDRQVRGEYPLKYGFNFTWRWLQMQVMDDPEYPYESSSAYQRLVDNYVGDPAHRQRMWLTDMQMWDVGSDVETRVVGPLLGLHLLRPELMQGSEPVRLLNIGASRNHSLAAMVANLPFPDVRISAATPVEARELPLYQRAISRLLRQRVELGDSLAVDLWPLDDPERSKMVESCRFYPGELRQPELRERYGLLEVARDASPQLHQIDLDFATPHIPAYHENFRHGKVIQQPIRRDYHAAFIMTCAYQNTIPAQEQMFRNAEACTVNDSVIFVQEFSADRPLPVGDSPISRLEIVGPQTPNTPEGEQFPYTLWAYDKLHPEHGLRKLATFNDARCGFIKPSPLCIVGLDRAIQTATSARQDRHTVQRS